MSPLIARSIGYLGQPLNDEQRHFIDLQIALVILATIAVALRLGARAIAKVRLWWDDYTILVGLLFCYGMLAHAIISCKFGLGVSHAFAKIEVYFKESLIFFCVYICAITTIKISILLMYYRIFKVQPFKKAVYIVGGVLTLWFFITFFLTLFECVPVHYFWTSVLNPMEPGSCMNRLALFEATAAVNSILDVVILALPVRMVWGLQLSIAKRIQLTITFLLGAFVCVISIIRLVAVITQKETDPTKDEMGDVVWTTTEIYVGVISACLPTLRPLLTKGSSIFSQYASKLSTGRSSTRSTPSASKKHFWGSSEKSLQDHSPSPSISPPTSSGETCECGRPTKVAQLKANWSQPGVSQWQGRQSNLATKIRGSSMQPDLESGLPSRGIIVEREMESSWTPRR